MARRRMIEITTSHDKDLNSLSVFAELLYHRILPHTDDYGRFEGDPEVVKARVMPLRKKPLAAIEGAMREISEAGLWTWFRLPSGKMVVQYKEESFERINAFLIKNRGNSEFPPYKKEYELICGDMAPYHLTSNKQKAISNKQKEKDMVVPEKILYGDDVRLMEKEYMRLGELLGDGGRAWCIHKLDNYLGQSEKNRKRYSSHYKAILNWVVGEWKKEADGTHIGTANSRGGREVITNAKVDQLARGAEHIAESKRQRDSGGGGGG